MADPKYVKIGLPETKVMEECSELIKAICKAERFGWDTHHPEYPPEKTNAVVVCEEIDDVVARCAELKEAIKTRHLFDFEIMQQVIKRTTRLPQPPVYGTQGMEM